MMHDMNRLNQHHYQAQVSQSQYVTGDRTISALQADLMDTPPPWERTHLMDTPPPWEKAHLMDTPPPWERAHLMDTPPPWERAHLMDTPPPWERVHLMDTPPPWERTHLMNTPPPWERVHPMPARVFPAQIWRGGSLVMHLWAGSTLITRHLTSKPSVPCTQYFTALST